MGDGFPPSHRSVDQLGRVYEYFLTRFASAEGKNGGQFYTPSSRSDPRRRPPVFRQNHFPIRQMQPRCDLAGVGEGLAGTRVLLGAGIALLAAKHLSDEQRQTAGVVLAGIGLLTTIPLALEVMGKTKVE